jgi:hypothetical protein
VNLLTTAVATTNGSQDVSLMGTSPAYGILFQCQTTAGTATVAGQIDINNIRILGTRDGLGISYPNEPVYGHEVIQDIVISANQGNPQVNGDTSGITSDTSYSFDSLVFLQPTPRRQILDYVTSFYDRYWAIWEDRRMVWNTYALSNPSRNMRLGQALSANLKTSIMESANNIVVKWQDIEGNPRSLTVADPRPDNVFTLAGKKGYQIIDLGITGVASTAYGFGSIGYPDHSYETVRGQVTFPCGAIVAGDEQIPAYKLRAGDVMRLQDIVQFRDLQTGSSDRRSTFLIRRVDVDWDSQTVTVDLDNTFDALTQLMARTDLALQAKFGVN